MHTSRLIAVCLLASISVVLARQGQVTNDRSSQTVNFSGKQRGIVAVNSKRSATAPATAPVFTNWWGNITEVLVQAGGVSQEANVVSSWQVDENYNRTSYYGTNVNDLIADFGQMTLFYMDWQRICQYTCTIVDVNDPCNSQVNGNSLCTYDQINRSQFVDEVEIDGVQTYHYSWQDPLANISMAEHELWVDTEKLLPVQFFANFHPFGTFEANWTATYNTFSAGTPPAANFAISNLEYCYPGSDAQCADANRKLAAYMKMTKPLHKRGDVKILTEQ